MPKYTVSYFNLKGLAEGIRMLLAYGGEDFVDNRVSNEDWPAMKWKTPFGMMPVLEEDGEQFAQSLSICRYLGKKYGLVGANPKEDLIIDQNMEFFNETRQRAAGAFFEQNETIKAIKLADNKKQLPELIAIMERIVKENNGHVAVGKLTWADFVFAGFYDAFRMASETPDMDDRYPNLKRVKQTVTSLPKVKEYWDAAPVTPF